MCDTLHVCDNVWGEHWPDGHVDLGVEEADGGEGDQAQHQQPRPVDVPRDVHLVHPGGEQVRRHNVVRDVV